MAGPPVVERGVGEKVSKGTTRWIAHPHPRKRRGGQRSASETEAFAMIRRFLSYLPSNVSEAPPRADPLDDPPRREEELIAIIPRDRRRSLRRPPHPCAPSSTAIRFSKSVHRYGRPVVCALARVNGYPVGIIANDPRQAVARPTPLPRQNDPPASTSATPSISRASTSSTIPASSSARAAESAPGTAPA